MIGWCAVSAGWTGSRTLITRSRVVHASSGCERLKTAVPWQVWVDGDRMWIPPVDRSSEGGLFRWCGMCEPQPALPDWHERAACRGAGSDWWFPSSNAKAKYAKARRVCMSCSVRSECLDWGVGEEFGMWGGMTETERRA